MIIFGSILRQLLSPLEDVPHSIRTYYSIFDFQWRTPLLAAVFYGRLEMIRLLVKYGADVNICLAGHTIALTTAPRAGCFRFDLHQSSAPTKEIIQLLVDLGAEINLCMPADQARAREILGTSHEELDDVRSSQNLPY